MNLTNEVKSKIEQRYKLKPTAGIDTFLIQNKDVDQFLQLLLQQQPWFENKRRAFALIAKGVYQPIKCKKCNQIISSKKCLKRGIQYCSNDCSRSSSYRMEKVKQTMLKNYGVDNPAKSKIIQNKIKQTNLQKYGCQNVFQNEQIKQKIEKTNLQKYGKKYFTQTEQFIQKSKQTNLKNRGVEFPAQSLQVREKAKKTNLEIFGVQYPAQSQAIMNKMKSTCLDRYGVEYSLQSPEIDSKRQETWHIRYGGNPSSNEEIIKKRKATNFERYGYQAGYPQSLEYMTIQFNKIKERFAGKIQPLFDQNNYHGINSKQVYKWRCVKCGNEFEQDIHYTYIDENEHLLPRCLKCYPYLTGFSKSEKSLLEYIKQIYNSEIIENDRTLLKQYELDIVLPELKLAIQFNGIYWHNADKKDKNYHLNKTELCEMQGFRLIHIWQDEWNNNKEILLNKLKSIIEDNEIIEDNILDRCWYSTLQFDNYKILQPEIIIRDGYQLYNCGYIELI